MATPIIGQAEIQIIAQAAGFNAQAARAIAPGLTQMNRAVQTATKAAAGDFDKMGVAATKAVTGIADGKALTNFTREVAKAAKSMETSFVDAAKTTSTKVDAELSGIGKGLDTDLTRTAQRAATGMGREFDGLGVDIQRTLVDAGSVAARQMPAEFNGTGRDIAQIIDREVDAARIRTDVAADVQIDRGAIAADLSQAVGQTQVPLEVDTGRLAADVSSAVNSVQAGLQVDQADITRQVEQAVERAGDATLNLAALTAHIRQAIERGTAGADVSVGGVTARQSLAGLGGTGGPDTSILRDFSVAAAADRLDDSVASKGGASAIRAVLDDKSLSDSLAKTISTATASGIKLSVPKALVESVEKAEIRPNLNRRIIAESVVEAVNQADIKLFPRPAATRRSVTDIIEEAAKAAGVRLTVDKTDLQRQILEAATAVDLTPDSPDTDRRILGASERAAITITPDYQQVARDIERAVEQADIEIPIDYTAVARSMERTVEQADIKLGEIVDQPGVRRSILEAAEKVGPIKIHADPIALAADMQKAVEGSLNKPIKINADYDALGRDIKAILGKQDIKIGVNAKEISGADLAFQRLVDHLRDGADVDLNVDLADLRQAFDLANKLAKTTAKMTVDTDLTELQKANDLANALDSFVAVIDLQTNGEGKLREALEISDALERVATIAIDVKGKEDLREAGRIADDLERTRTVPIAARKEDLIRLQDSITSAGEGGAEGVDGAMRDIDFADIGGSALDQLTGAIGAAGPWAAVAAGVGAVFGDEFLEGVNNALPSGRQDTIRALKYNLAESDMKAIGEAGGAAYSAGLSESLVGAKDAAAVVKGELGNIDKDLDLSAVTEQATALEQVFGVDVATSVASVDKLISQKLVPNAEVGFNLLFELGQQTGTQFDEMLELSDEFSTSIKALGIEGPKGLKLIGDMVEQNIFPQVDQAGEVFQEFFEIVSNGQAADTLEKIGLNAEEMQRRIAAGGPDAAKATKEIATALLAVDDEGQQAADTTAIFGSNMGYLSDEARNAALELFATADGTEAVGTGASDAAAKIEGAASGLDRLKKLAVDLGNELGTTVADVVDLGNALAIADWDTFGDKAEAVGKKLATSLLGPMQELAGPIDRLGDKLGFDVPNAFDLLDGKIDRANPKLLSHSDALKKTGDAAADAADGLGETKDAVQALDDQISIFSGRFDEDQVMRQLQEDTEKALESVKGLTGASYDLGTGFDISTEAGRAAQSAMEDLSGNLDNLIDLNHDHRLSAEEVAAGQQLVEGTLRDVAARMGLTEDETRQLIERYGQVPKSLVTQISAIDYASAVVKNLQTQLSGLKDKTITITAKNAVIAATAATAGKRAKGGGTRGLTLLGEEGPELVDFSGDAFVYTANQTKGLLSSGAVRAFAQGGLATQPSIAGEDGPELILPLTKPDRIRALLDQYGSMLLAALGEQGVSSLTSIATPAAPAASTKTATTTTDDKGIISALYEAILNRATDEAGAAYWQQLLANQNASPQDITAAFLRSPEAAQLQDASQQAGGALGQVDAEFITSLYETVLHRASDETGASYWQQLLTSGAASRDDVTTAFWVSPEAQNLLSATDTTAATAGLADAAFVDKLYNDILGRAGDEAGKSYWLELLANQTATRDDVTYSFFSSAEFQNFIGTTQQTGATAGLTDAEFINGLYTSILGRAGDEAGVAYWSTLLSGQAATRDDVAAMFEATPEARAMSSKTVAVAASYGLKDASYIDTLYRNVLGRVADEAGLAYWTGLLSSGKATGAQIEAQLMASAEAQVVGAAQQAGTFNGINDSQFIDQLYANILGRAADETGKAYWEELLSSGRSTRLDVTGAFRSSAEATNLRGYALGGLADTPSIFGEDGLELALPLTKPARLRELLSQYGDLLASAVGGPIPALAAAQPAYATVPAQTPPAAEGQAGGMPSKEDIAAAVEAGVRAAVDALANVGPRSVVHNTNFIDRRNDYWDELSLID